MNLNGRTVLIVEDNEKLNRINRRALEKQGLTVLTAFTLSEARELLKTSSPEVILLDVMLPDGDGMDFCAGIRGSTDAHILFLSARTEYADKIRGLDTGGDDYITKPYLLSEMLSRVRAALRRRDIERTRPPEQTFTLRSITLDLVAATAIAEGKDLGLTGKEFSVLLLLAQNEGIEIPTAEVYETVWRQPLASDKQSVKTIVSRLRKKL